MPNPGLLQFSEWITAPSPFSRGPRSTSLAIGLGGIMPGHKHLRGVSAKEQREYEHIKESAEKSGRYGSRAKEVAARTVLKQHKAKGHAKGR
jgi:hypothetical protein